MNQKTIKGIARIFLVIVVLNLLLFALRVYSTPVFWSIIIISAIVAFPVMNAMKKKANKTK